MTEKIMLINYIPDEECRIAVIDQGKLEELYSERANDESHVNNIYQGRITNVEPSIQAAFIDFGLERNGFLHISDVHPKFFPGDDHDTIERVGKKTPRKERPPIQQCLSRGDVIQVQVLKEGIGTKGPTLTSYLSIPGRFLVMMPDMERAGVSRKIEDDETRRKIRKILDQLDPPDGFGFIVRTAGMDRTKAELKRDLAYLNRLWVNIEKRQQQCKGPALLYAESDLIIRTLRDVLGSDIKQIVIDNAQAAIRAKDFLRLAMPRGGVKVFYYDQHVPLFDAYDIERQIDMIHARTVPLKSGGSLVIDSTEALVAIDVNSGSNRDNANAEETAYRTNLEAAEEICRQLRLRDLGGVIVNDLIDMYQTRHRRAVEKKFRDCLKSDRARTHTLKISELGLLEMTRQRMRPSIRKALYTECPACNGIGQVMSADATALQIMRSIAVTLHNDLLFRVNVTVSPKVATAMLNRMRKSLVRLEKRTGKCIEIVADATISTDHFKLQGFDQRGVRLDVERFPAPKTPQLSDLKEVKLRKDVSDVLTDSDTDPLDDEPEITGNDELEFVKGDSDADNQNNTGIAKSRKPRRRRRKSSDNNKSDTDRSQNNPTSDQQDHAKSKPANDQPSNHTASDQAGRGDDKQADSANPKEHEQDQSAPNNEKRRSRRSRGRRRRKNTDNDAQSSDEHAGNTAEQNTKTSDNNNQSPDGNKDKNKDNDRNTDNQNQSGNSRKRRRRSSHKRSDGNSGNQDQHKPSQSNANQDSRSHAPNVGGGYSNPRRNQRSDNAQEAQHD